MSRSGDELAKPEDLAMPPCPDIVLYIAEFRGDRSGEKASVWADRLDAQAFIEDQIDFTDIEWEKEDHRWIAIDGGTYLASVTRMPLADPVSLAGKFPDELAHWCYVDPEELMSPPSP